MPKLKDTELRVMLVVFEKTINCGKKRDWISHRQFVSATKERGADQKYCSRQVSRAITTLISVHGLLEAETERGRLLTTPQARMKNYGKIYYRLSSKVIPTFSYDIALPALNKATV